MFSCKQAKTIMIPRVLEAGELQSVWSPRLLPSPQSQQLFVWSPKMFSTAYQLREAIPAREILFEAELRRLVARNVNNSSLAGIPLKLASEINKLGGLDLLHPGQETTIIMVPGQKGLFFCALNALKPLKFSSLVKQKQYNTVCTRNLKNAGIFQTIYICVHMYACILAAFILRAENITLFVFPLQIFHPMTVQAEPYLDSCPELNARIPPLRCNFFLFHTVRDKFSSSNILSRLQHARCLQK